MLMPIFSYEAPSFTLRGLFRPEFDVLDGLPFYTPALIGLAAALAVAAGLVLARARTRGLSPGIPGGSLSREEALGHVRRVKAELQGRKGEAAVAEVLARAGLPALHDVIVQDDWGLTQVDHLVRLPDGIAVLETKTHGGTVTGQVRDRRWVQEFRGGRVRTAFRSPVLQNDRHVRAVRRVAGAGVAVHGLVVSAGSARFCGDLERAVVRLDGLLARLREGPAVACDVRRLDAAWRLLTVAAGRSAELRGAHLRQVRQRRSCEG